MQTKDNPGIYIPPPLIYAAIFLISIPLQKSVTIPVLFFKTMAAEIIGWILIFGSLMISLPAVIKFIKTKNSIIPLKSARSLQTTGIFLFTRNPMYLGLLILYIGIALLVGNWWTIILIPVLIVIINTYVIKREEKYLEREFEQQFRDYKKKVRRWI